MSTESATPTVASAWYHGPCPRCQRSVELAIAVEGKATYYRLQLPFRDERGDDDAPHPVHLVSPEDESQPRSIRDVVCDLLEARELFAEALDDQAISDGPVGWPPTLEPAIECWPRFRPWCDVIARLLGVERGGSLRGPPEWVEGPYEVTSRFRTGSATGQA